MPSHGLVLLLAALCWCCLPLTVLAHIERFDNVLLPPSYHYKSSSILSPKNIPILSTQLASVELQLQFTLHKINNSFPERKGAIYIIAHSDLHDFPVAHDLSFMKVRGSCPPLDNPSSPLFAIPTRADLSYFRFELPAENAKDGQVIVGDIRTKISVSYRSSWTLEIFHCQDRISVIQAPLDSYVLRFNGSVVWKNTFGYASYDEFVPHVYIYTILCVAYLITTTYWGFLLARYHVDVHMYQKVVMALLPLGFVSCIAVLSERIYHNSSGLFDQGFVTFSIAVPLLLESLGRGALLVLVTGYRISRHSLGFSRKIFIVVLTATYFVATVSLGILSSRQRLNYYSGSGSGSSFDQSYSEDAEVAQLVHTLLMLPIFLLEAIFWGWSIVAVDRTLQKLLGPQLMLGRRQPSSADHGERAVKENIFVHVKYILTVCGFLLLLRSLIELFITMFRAWGPSSPARWIFDVCGTALTFAMLTSIAFLCFRPSSENGIINFSPEGPHPDNEETTELELIPIASLDDE